MNAKQRIVVLLAMLVITVLGLFPPWLERADIPYKIHFDKALGYRFISSPPGSTLIGQPGLSYLKDATTIRVDFSRLLIEWIIVVAITAALLLVLRSSTKTSEHL